MRPKNIPVGELNEGSGVPLLSAVSPEILKSVYRVLVWNCVEREPQRPPNYPTEEDERVALEFARAIRLACEEGEEALPNVGQSWELTGGDTVKTADRLRNGLRTIEYRRADDSMIGVICVGWGRANWRPNQLYAGYVPPQVIARTTETTPEANEALVVIAKEWFRENHRRNGEVK